MFIELTDHLRCPEAHEEQFLVLLPERLADRRVEQGRLGCPVCGRTFPVEDWVADFGAGGEAPAEAGRLDAAGIQALLGLDGPGGAVVLVGAATATADALAPLLEGVHLVLVNAPADVRPAPGRSLLRAPGIPLKAATVRGAVLGAGSDPAAHWLAEAQRVVLPGLRLVVEGPPPEGDGGPEVLAEAEGVWVARKGR